MQVLWGRETEITVIPVLRDHEETRADPGIFIFAFFSAKFCDKRGGGGFQLLEPPPLDPPLRHMKRYKYCLYQNSCMMPISSNTESVST